VTAVSLESVRTLFTRFAEIECKGYSNLYYELSRAVAGDDELSAFVAPMPVIQPNLFFASVQFLTGADAMPASRTDLRRFLRRHGASVAHLMRTRRTQTNEVGRCAVLLPALPPGPIALLEVGASAGLCLLMDEFRYDYGGAPIGPESSPVRLHCTTQGNPPVPAANPEIRWRCGLDIAPVNVLEDDAARWLLACVWADHPERRDRLAAAMALNRQRPVPVRRGDLVTDLPALINEVPRDATLVVFHSAVLAYVTVERRLAFAEMLAEASHMREIVWVSNEAPGVVADVSTFAAPAPAQQWLLGRVRFTRGERFTELLARAHPHGGELWWLAPSAISRAG
jgi:hypothetical protein